MKTSKESIDDEIAKNSAVLENEPYVKKAILRIIIKQRKDLQKMDVQPGEIKELSDLLTKEYHDEYEGIK